MQDVLIYIGHHGAEVVTLIIGGLAIERVAFHIRRRKKKARKHAAHHHAPVHRRTPK